MKIQLISSSLATAALAFANNYPTIKDAIMQPASFGWHSPVSHGHGFDRQLPGFSGPANHGM